MSLISEFKDFTLKGNVIDLAVGVIIGGAFGGIVSSLVKDVITPLIAAVLAPFGGQPDFSKYALFAHKVIAKDGKETLEGGIMYGNFLNALVGFIIIAAVIFFVFVKPMNHLKAIAAKKAAEAPPAPPAADVALLTEIRDLLKNKA